jgi:glutamyl-tRNA reductase
LKHLKVIAFTHKQIELKELGKLVLCQENLTEKLQQVQKQFDIPEMFYLSTCNRVEFVMATAQPVDRDFAQQFLQALSIGLCPYYMNTFIAR